MIDKTRPSDCRVAVLLGGHSREREISLKSGRAVLAALARLGIEAVAVDPVDDMCAALLRIQPTVVFIALHGGAGEDGTVQGALEVLGLPYVGSGVAACAAGMDKLFSKYIWQGLGLSVLPCLVLTADQRAAPPAPAFDYPLCIKPVSEGSSLGVTFVEKPQDYPDAVAHVLTFDERIMVEPWIVGEEYTVGFLDQLPLPVIRIAAQGGFYDYAAKYERQDTQFYCPSGLDAETEQWVQWEATQAYRALGGQGWGRIDLLRDSGSGQFWLMEANFVPGMSDSSLVPRAARQLGMSFDDLVLRLLQTAVPDFLKAPA